MLADARSVTISGLDFKPGTVSAIRWTSGTTVSFLMSAFTAQASATLAMVTVSAVAGTRSAQVNADPARSGNRRKEATGMKQAVNIPIKLGSFGNNSQHLD